MFAEDCLLYRAVKTFRDHVQLQQDLLLVSVQNLAKTLGIKLNAQKCYILRLSPTRKPITGYYTL